MKTGMLAVAVLVTLAPGAVDAQGHSPYSGQHERTIKALSDDETHQYLAGAGMGYARAAELNGYPGPMHVLELADRLGLSAEQRAATQRLMEKHKAEARVLGTKRVAAEKALDGLFTAGAVEKDQLAAAVRETTRIEGEYRLAHLDTHRQMRDLLTEAQVAQYNELRGYSGEKQGH